MIDERNASKSINLITTIYLQTFSDISFIQALISIKYRLIMSENTVVQLNGVVGCHLLKFLDGIDATNFIEAVDNSEQFGSIAKTFDYHFVRLISVFCDYRRILLPRAIFESFMDESEIDDEQLVVVSTRYSSFIQPSERLYIHPCFSLEGFSKLCEVYKTSLFKCYCRLLPLNTVCYNYNADFGLLDYEWYGHTVGRKRILNDHENKLFKVNTNFPMTEDRTNRTNLIFVRTMNEFKQNLAIRFSSASWLGAIDFSKLFIAGGCVLNALCCSPFSDTKEQDVNLFYYEDNISNFKTTVQSTVNILNKIISCNLTNAIKMEKIPGTSSYNVFLPCNVRLHFSSISTGNLKQPLSHILHNFDVDICQVAFTGDKIVSTFPFLQALATRSFIVYTLHAESPKHLCARIAKYCNRGFDLLVPINFDGDFQSMIIQEETPLYRVEHQHHIDDDGESRITIKEFYRIFVRNVDTFRLQEKFMLMVCPQLLQYK